MKINLLSLAFLFGIIIVFSQKNDEQLLNDFSKDLCYCSKDEFNNLHPKAKDLIKGLATNPEKAQEEFMSSILSLNPSESEKLMQSLQKMNDGSLQKKLEECNESVKNNPKYTDDFLDRVFDDEKVNESIIKILEKYPECETYRNLLIFGTIINK